MSRDVIGWVCFLGLTVSMWAATAAAQTGEPAAAVVVDGVAIDGPAPPSPPDISSRDAQDRVTIRAIRLKEGLKIDGQLDEEIYQTYLPANGFIQREPKSGQPATEKTDLWIAFDSDNIYLTVRCWDSHPERWVVNEMRRDNNNIPRNENVAFFFDTFYDRRNAFLFEINPIGGFYDTQVTNEKIGGTDWNPVWQRKTGRFQGGWAVEAAIPFKSLRYKPGASQVWGFQMRRTIRWKNEETFLTRLPQLGGSGSGGIL